MDFLNKEEYYGNIEYKLYINPKKKDRILSQFFFRMREGNGRAFYYIGIHDYGKLYIKELKYLLPSIKTFIDIISKSCKYNVRIFVKKPYVFALVYCYNPAISNYDDIIDFNAKLN